MSEDFDKYLEIANRDMQAAENMRELKSYVACLLYDNDKKMDIIEKLKAELISIYTGEYSDTKEEARKRIRLLIERGE